MRRLAILIVTLLLGWLALPSWPDRQSRADDQPSLLAGVIAKALSSPDITVRIGSVEGALSSQSTIRDLSLADSAGVFLRVDRVDLDWRRAALLSRRLEVNRLLIGEVSLLRKPSRSSKAVDPTEPLLPELPLKLVVNQFELREFVLDQAVMGHAARLTGAGRLSLGAPSEGLDLDLGIRRLDREGQVALKLSFVPKGEILDLSARISEASGGVLAHLARLPDEPGVTLTLSGTGPLDAWNGQLAAQAGPEIGATGTASIRRAGSARQLALNLSGRIAPLLPPVAARLFHGETAVTVRAGWPDGSGTVEIAEASLAANALHLRGAGRIGPGVTEARITGSLTDLAPLDPRLKGALALVGTWQGEGAAARLALDVTSPVIEATGHPIRDLALGLTVQDPLGTAQGNLRATGQVDGQPLEARAGFLHSSERKALEAITFTLGQNRATGDLALANDRLSGQLQLDLARLDQLSGLMLAPYSGALKGQVTFAEEEGKQGLRMALAGPAFSGFGASLRNLKADLTLSDAFGSPRLAGTASADAVAVAGQSLGRVSLVAQRGAGYTDLAIEAKGGATGVNGAARITDGDETRIDITRLLLSRAKVSARLVAPITAMLREGSVDFGRADFTLGNGTLALSGRAGRQSALKMRATGVSLAQVRAFVPSFAFSGTLDAEAELSGDIAKPNGPYSLSIRQFSHPDLRQSGLPALDIKAKGALSEGKATVAADLVGGQRLSLAVQGTVPISPAGALDLALRGTLDAGLANARLASQGQRLSGQLRVDATLKGRLNAPLVGGTATLSGGSFIDPLQGLRFTDIQGRLSGMGERIRIENLQATTPGGGSVRLAGSLLADPTRGFPADITLRGQAARLVENDVMILVADLDLSVTGPLAGTPALSGSVLVRSLDIMIPERLASASAPLPNAKHIAPPEETRARLAIIAKAKQQRAQRRATSQGGPRLSIRVEAPSRISVRGRGIDAELGGSLELGGTLHAPRATGGFDLRRGQIDMLTQRLNFSRGRITFKGDTIPDLDFLSATTAGGVTAKVAVTGRADEPVFALTSEPQLPPDEVLSRLMFERAAGTLSPFQAIQLAQAVARLTGQGGPDFLDRTRKALGVDTLDVDMGKSGPRVGASRYISNSVRLGVKTGTTPEESGLSVNVDVTRRIKLQGEATKDGRGSVGIGAEIEY